MSIEAIEKNETTLTVSEIQRFCMHDGPGLRTTVFLKGCPLGCAWCHNPETQRMSKQLLFYEKKCVLCGGCEVTCTQGVHKINATHIIDRPRCTVCGKCIDVCPTGAVEICGRDMKISEIVEATQKDIAFYGEQGGITVSGGEPFAHKYATVELLKKCKEAGLNTAVETCGYTDPAVLQAALPYVDLFLWDIKDTNDKRHRQYTGVGNKLILDNLDMINRLGGKVRLRCILVNGVNTEKEHYRSLAEIALSLDNFDGIDFLPYHAYAGAKATFIGLEDNGKPEWIPSKMQSDEANEVFNKNFGK